MNKSTLEKITPMEKIASGLMLIAMALCIFCVATNTYTHLLLYLYCLLCGIGLAVWFYILFIKPIDNNGEA